MTRSVLRSHDCLLGLLSAVLVGVTGCGSDAPVLETFGPPPELRTLDTLTHLRATPTFRPSGASGARDCSITVVGRNWGTLARIRPDGVVDSAFAAPPTGRRLSSLESVDGATLVWSPEPALVATIAPDGLDSLPLPRHSWGGRWVGPSVPMRDGRVAVAPISNRRKWIPSPDPWIDAPLFFVVDDRGEVVARGGEISYTGGKYLTWLAHRAALGARGDTVFALTLSDARLEAYLVEPGDTIARKSSSLQLPRYFEAPEPREEVHSHTALGDEGDTFVQWQVSHAVTAAFGGDRLYVIRNYDAEWVDDLNNSFDPNAVWRPTAQGLEIHDLRGEVLERLALPESGASWIRADGVGRILIGVRDGVVVARDPTTTSPCQAMPRTVDLKLTDEPPVSTP